MTAPTPTPDTSPDVFAFNITPEFCKALADFQAELPKIDKNKLVEVETRKEGADDYDYSYASLDHVSHLSMPQLGRHGLSFTSYPGANSNGRGLSLRYFLMHASGGYIGCEWPILPTDLKGARAMQSFGAMVTYIRRYAFMAATGVAADLDDDDLRSAVAREDKATAPTARRNAAAAREKQAEQNTARVGRRARNGEEPPAEQSRPQRDPDAPVASGTQGHMFGLFTKIGYGARDDETRAARLAVSSDLVGRALTSANDLTTGEAQALIDVLQACVDAGGTIDARQEALAAALDAARAEPGGATEEPS
jgi:ERF superfamily